MNLDRFWANVINGKNRLVGREIFYVEPTEANK